MTADELRELMERTDTPLPLALTGETAPRDEVRECADVLCFERLRFDAEDGALVAFVCTGMTGEQRGNAQLIVALVNNADKLIAAAEELSDLQLRHIKLKDRWEKQRDAKIASDAERDTLRGLLREVLDIIWRPPLSLPASRDWEFERDSQDLNALAPRLAAALEDGRG